VIILPSMGVAHHNAGQESGPDRNFLWGKQGAGRGRQRDSGRHGTGMVRRETTDPRREHFAGICAVVHRLHEGNSKDLTIICFACEGDLAATYRISAIHHSAESSATDAAESSSALLRLIRSGADSAGADWRDYQGSSIKEADSRPLSEPYSGPKVRIHAAVSPSGSPLQHGCAVPGVVAITEISGAAPISSVASTHHLAEAVV
jgi:hypothetical protein